MTVIQINNTAMIDLSIEMENYWRLGLGGLAVLL